MTTKLLHMFKRYIKTTIWVALSLVVCTTPAFAAQPAPYPGFACRILAARQQLPGASAVDFRMVKLTFAAGTVGAQHRHRYGEILYLLSGSGTSTSESGAVTALSSDRALVIPPGTYHKLTPAGNAALTVLSVQFPQHHAASFDPKPAGSDQCKP